MLDWLKKLGGSKPFENRVGLDENLVQLLANDFIRWDEVADGISKRILRYLLDDEGEMVLAELAGLSNAIQTIQTVWQVVAQKTSNQPNPRNEFFKMVRAAPVGFFRRLGYVYEASTRQNQHRVSGAFGDPRLDWLEIFLVQGMFNYDPETSPITAGLVEELLELDGWPRGLLVRGAFEPDLRKYGWPEHVFVCLSGLAQSVLRHREVLIEALKNQDFKQRVHALKMMTQCGVPANEFFEPLVELAFDPSKEVRQEAHGLLSELKTEALPLIEGKLVNGKVDEKVVAVELLWAWAGEGARGLLEDRLTKEKNKKVLIALERTLAVATAVAVPSKDEQELILPPMDPMPSRAPLGPETERAWQECFAQFNAAIAQYNARYGSQAYQRAKPSDDAICKSFAAMQTGENQAAFLGELNSVAYYKEMVEPFRVFWQRPELSLVHLARFLLHVGETPDKDYRFFFGYGDWLSQLMPIYRRAHPEVGLRELGAAFAAAGLNPRRIGSGILMSIEQPLPLGLPRDKIWPYWAEHLDLLEEVFAPGTNFQGVARRNAFHALATFPHPPERLAPVLWKLALGKKTERALAQRCLERAPDKVERLLAFLSRGDTESRAAAAEWLSRLGDTRAMEPLMATLQKEKNEMTKGAIMSALEQLGAPVEKFLNREALLKEAEVASAEEVPDELKWFPFVQLPVVHWSDNAQPVDAVILKWWLIQGFKLKSPEPSPLLRKYCASLEPKERQALGQFVLEAWLGEDTAPIPRAQAEKQAMDRAQMYVRWKQIVPNAPQKTLEQCYADFLPEQLLQPKGSAISSKGVLSVAGACGGPGIAPAVGRYLKTWYGMRAAQCHALLQMLAWVEHKSATQLLLAVASRFRTKGIQEEANKQAQALAQRKGWTVAELADRTIPTAGMDEDGVLTLDFGPRQFAARLNENLEIVLTDNEGNRLKALPDPRRDDDETKAAEAKKVFSASKKELKSVLAMQQDRLYEAMCTQRTWPFEDWNLYLNQHPIARHYCQRLVWAVVRDEKIITLFRPLPDGSLTDANDDPVTVKPKDLVRLAHECHSTPEQSLVWHKHLKDYEVDPLFDQFGKPHFELTEERKQEEELADFQGHLVEAFKLRGRGAKLGYTRGQTEDGGWFYQYNKRFPTLGIQAVLEFSGNNLPEDNRTVALKTLHFERLAVEGEITLQAGRMTLGEVPQVLLSECWNDIRQIAAEGTGFDPEWEQITQM